MLGETPVSQEHVRDWADGLDLPIGGETVLFVDCEAAFYRTSVPRAVAQILQLAGYEFGLMGEQWCCGGPAAEMGYVDQARRFAEHNLDNWRSTGTKRVLVLDPHDYITFTEDYPKYFGADFDIEVVLVVELFAELIREGRLTPSVPIERTITYHDPCRLNKRKGIWKEPREILRAIPGLDFNDVDRVTQWSYCSGGGGGLPVEKPELTAAIRADRLDKAAALEVDTLVSACPWSERPLGEAGDAATSTSSTSTSCSPSRSASRSADPPTAAAHDHRGRAARRGRHRAAHRAGRRADPHLQDRPVQPGPGAGAVPGAPLGRAAPRPRRAARPPPRRSPPSSGSPTSCGSRSSRATAAPGSPTARSRCAAASWSTSSG